MDRTLVIVDVETTGGFSGSDRITEIALLRVENGKVVKRFQSLVNPEQPIPQFITNMTGISNDMVRRAPIFGDIREEVLAIMQDAVFVAHNVRFDYGFVRNELARVGEQYRAPLLCSVRLSRALFPEHRRHDLSSIIERHAIPCKARHRAMGDAEVVWKFFQQIRKKFDEAQIETAVSKVMKSPATPQQLESKSLAALPKGHGVYTFYNEDDEPIYVGKSVSVAKRVRSHFYDDNRSAKEAMMGQAVHHIGAVTTHGELGALLLENYRIKADGPMYNRMSRKVKKMHVLTETETPEGYLTAKLQLLDPSAMTGRERILAIVRSKRGASELLSQIAREHALCEKLLGTEKQGAECFAFQLGKCFGACSGKEAPMVYNRRFLKAFARQRVKQWPYTGAVTITERGEDGETVFAIDHWVVKSARVNGMNDLIPKQTAFDFDAYRIIARYILAHPETVEEYISVD